jgi:short subunit dehydrogenase-like uncharacterized protein
MRQMIDKHEAAAKSSGARIVFSCGFDSVPFELGTIYVQEEAKRVFGTPAPRVKGRVRDINLIFTTLEESGGTHEGTTLTVPNSLFFQRAVRRWHGGAGALPAAKGS